jgi:hypothetical protein
MATLQRQTSKAAMEAGMRKCAGCDKALGLEIVEAMSSSWHPSCFVCGACKEPFQDGRFVWNAKEHKPYHKACLSAAGPSAKDCGPRAQVSGDGPTCKGCGLAIDGKYVVVQGEKYHSTCFVCGVCGCTLQGGYGLSKEGNPLCATHLGEQQGAKSRVPLDGPDKYRIDVSNHEKIFIESGTRREYRIRDGVKAYEDERVRPKYGGNTTWRQG